MIIVDLQPWKHHGHVLQITGAKIGPGFCFEILISIYFHGDLFMAFKRTFDRAQLSMSSTASPVPRKTLVVAPPGLRGTAPLGSLQHLLRKSMEIPWIHDWASIHIWSYMSYICLYYIFFGVNVYSIYYIYIYYIYIYIYIVCMYMKYHDNDNTQKQ